MRAVAWLFDRETNFAALRLDSTWSAALGCQILWIEVNFWQNLKYLVCFVKFWEKSEHVRDLCKSADLSQRRQVSIKTELLSLSCWPGRVRLRRHCRQQKPAEVAFPKNTLFDKNPSPKPFTNCAAKFFNEEFDRVCAFELRMVRKARKPGDSIVQRMWKTPKINPLPHRPTYLSISRHLLKYK